MLPKKTNVGKRGGLWEVPTKDDRTVNDKRSRLYFTRVGLVNNADETARLVKAPVSKAARGADLLHSLCKV